MRMARKSARNANGAPKKIGMCSMMKFTHQRRITMDHLLPYQVYNSTGNLVLQAAESCRYPKHTELSLMDAGYTIKINGRKLTKKEVK